MNRSKERVNCYECNKEMARGSLGRHLKSVHQIVMRKIETDDQLPLKKIKKSADEKTIDVDQASVAETVEQQESLIDYPSSRTQTNYTKDNIHIGLVEYITAIEKLKNLAKENLEATDRCIALYNSVYVKNLLCTKHKKFSEVAKLIPAKTNTTDKIGIYIDPFYLDIDLICSKEVFDRDVYVGISIDTRYLYDYLRLNRTEISASNLQNTKVPVPSMDVQKKITEWYDMRYDLMEKLNTCVALDNKDALDAYVHMKQNSGLDLL